MRSFRNCYLLPAICFISAALFACSKPIVPPPPDIIVVDSQVSPAVLLDSKTLSDEPVIFVRTINKTGYPDINLGYKFRNSLAESGRRMTRRSEGASYTVLVHYLYLDENNKNINVQKTLFQGFSAPLAISASLTRNTYLGVADLEIVENTTGKKYQTRICVELTPPNILQVTAREMIIKRTISEVNNIFSY